MSGAPSRERPPQVEAAIARLRESLPEHMREKPVFRLPPEVIEQIRNRRD